VIPFARYLATPSAMDGGSNNGGDDGSTINPILTDTTDTDGDGLYDVEEAVIGTDPNLVDTDNDGVNDGDEDADNDGISNFQESLDGTDPLVAEGGTVVDPDPDPVDPTPTDDPCDDADSANSSWNDNCQLKRFGTYASSSYSQGVQRILWCQGFGGDSTIESYADGAFGPNTARSVRNFQTANPPLVVDGIVGPETWAALRGKLNQIAVADIDIGGAIYTSHAIDGCDAATVQFYQEVSAFDELLGWKMALTPGSATLVDFSSGAPN